MTFNENKAGQATLKIGVLLDQYKITIWQAKVIDYILSDPRLSLQLVVLNKTQGAYSPQSSFFYRAIMKIDRFVFKTSKEAYLKINYYSILSQISTISIKQKSGKISTIFKPDDVAIIKGKKIDIFIRFGFGIIKGDILQASKFGVWSLHHGDNAVNRGGPPGFWEVVNQEAITGVTLQTISADLDGGEVIARSYLKTDNTSFSRNLDQVLWTGVELLQRKLAELGRNELETLQENKVGFYSKPLYRNPSNIASFKIFIRFWFRRVQETVLNKWSPQQWSILYKKDKAGQLEKSFFRYNQLVPPKGHDWADPFVIYHNNSYHLFFEELERKTKKGHISYLQFDEKGKLIQESKAIVLEEAHHLSYPFIMEWKNEFYMLPEAGNSRQLYLYKAKNFPYEWEKEQLLLDEALYDATLIQHQGTWYIFATQEFKPSKSLDMYLTIYYADDLLSSDWKKHPQSPVKTTVVGSRPAGKVFEYNDKLIRPAQIGAPKYGSGLQFYEIKELSKTAYKEVLLESIYPEWDKAILACHTFNSDKGFSVIDIQKRV